MSRRSAPIFTLLCSVFVRILRFKLARLHGCRSTQLLVQSYLNTHAKLCKANTDAGRRVKCTYNTLILQHSANEARFKKRSAGASPAIVRSRRSACATTACLSQRLLDGSAGAVEVVADICTDHIYTTSGSVLLDLPFAGVNLN